MNNTYQVISKTSGTIITVAEMKLYLRIDADDDDALIEQLINAAVKTAEKLMSRDLLTCVYANLRSDLNQDLTLRRGGFLSVSGVQYMDDGVYTTVDEDDYTVTTSGVYGKVFKLDVPPFDEHPEAIKIVFSSGFGASGSDIPEDIVTAIKAHVALMYENRGDCDTPGISNLIYKNNAIVDINGVF